MVAKSNSALTRSAKCWAEDCAEHIHYIVVRITFGQDLFDICAVTAKILWARSKYDELQRKPPFLKRSLQVLAKEVKSNLVTTLVLLLHFRVVKICSCAHPPVNLGIKYLEQLWRL